MNALPNKPVPANPRRILLLNPTRYLGNLLLAGGLIQDFAAHCRRHDRSLLVVLDASFRELCAQALTDVPVLWYPRQAMRRAGWWSRLRIFRDALAQIRAFRADLAFNIEEDTLSSRLTQLSGAGFKLGCSPVRHGFGYDHVVPLDHSRHHRWHGYAAMFRVAAGLEVRQPAYMNLSLNQTDAAFIQKLDELGVPHDKPLVAIHASATKDYKMWPEAAFSELCILLINQGFAPLLIGAGPEDAQRCEHIQRAVAGSATSAPVNLCGKLNLTELARLFLVCKGIVGNDSGPSHLASAQGLPGVVVFGPSDPALWGPLGARSQVIRKVDRCDPRCSRRACFAGYRCLHEIQPQEVLDALEARMETGAQP